MTISYAQRLEDILLLRALRDVERGFYVDLGAHDPVIDSVTKLFYEAGWSGINVEPSPHWFAKLAADRPRDVNLNFAVTDRSGTLTFHELTGTGLSTASDLFAERHVAAGFERVTYEVPTRTLAEICEAHAPGPIHFLKIDVEGSEEAALRGMDFRRFRPWIILAEATEPLTDVPSFAAWDPLLVEAGYDFVLFDGLNRFYVARERPELARFFVCPADDYVRAWAVRAEEAMHREIAALKARPA
ncbi:FkbM family methyltransferase [Methylobacterium sp. WSM2598]|uniref:FkbM family methyltransferase n=1 Tax=Methylobacterium sp. WSM2598 TaxID=398261 RepID=UPI00035E30B7|nr:FkbM family methyltransferase [Methylobacterium sp. WSM2598]